MCDCGQHLMHDAVQHQMKNLTKWDLKLDERGQYLFQHFDFGNKDKNSFLKAKYFVDDLAKLAEKNGHHPDITFGWGYCDVVLFTHTYKGLTETDFNIAKEINELYSRTYF
jgi:4a-hydroxytetrahydrobiopterin dehydratase